MQNSNEKSNEYLCCNHCNGDYHCPCHSSPKEEVDMGIDSECNICGNRMCICKERQSDKSWIPSPKVASSWEDKWYELLTNTIIDGGYDYDKEDSWLSQDKAEERLTKFISSTIKEERERLIGEIETIIKEKWKGRLEIPTRYEAELLNRIKSLS
jgi:hypothetical protein